METLNIEFVDAGEGFLVAKMPVNASVHQPMAYCTADFSSISRKWEVASSFFNVKRTRMELKYRQII
jgi:hypothetical protein